MGDKSPKAAQKSAAQKKSKNDQATQMKQAATNAKQVNGANAKKK